jgi:hypothetical protein
MTHESGLDIMSDHFENPKIDPPSTVPAAVTRRLNLDADDNDYMFPVQGLGLYLDHVVRSS